ncbi:MAG: dihydrolipoamide acetyltransferase family protein [Actinomycetota bacterium]
MAREFRLPDIGEGLTEAEIVRWVVPLGGTVAADETVVELETDKAVVEIPSPYGGVVLHHGAAEGEIIEVGDILVVIGEEGEGWSPDGDTAGEASPTGPAGEGQPPDSPDERGSSRPAEEEREEEGPEEEVEEQEQEEEEEEEVAPIVGTLPAGAEELPSREPLPATDSPRVEALPLVRKLARELGVSLDGVTGTGPGGRVTREDVMEAAQGKEAPAPRPAAVPPQPAPPAHTVPAGSRPESESRPLSKLRRTIADNMVRSWTTIPHVTTFDEVDATRLLATRSALAHRHDRSIPMEALIIKAVTPVLAAYPEFNATLDEDRLVIHGRHDIGVAVDTPDGLMVAVVRNADRRSLMGLAEEVRRLGEGARDRRLGADELTGQTFTVSNIGALGGGFGTPIVPPGTMAILSVGRAAERPVARNGRVEVAPVMPLSLSYDHRIIDGGTGRRFMAMLLENLAEPGLFLAE